MDIPLPKKGVVLHAPWWYAILWWGKDRENRSSRTSWREPLAMISSAETDDLEVLAAIAALRREGLVPANEGTDAELLARMRADAGKLVGVIQVKDAQPNSSLPVSRWAHTGKVGWVLSERIAVSPIAASGTQGLFSIAVCPACGTVGAVAKMPPTLPVRGGKHQQGARYLRCYRCRVLVPSQDAVRPALTRRS